MAPRPKPEWRKLHEGLNLEGTCQNVHCETRGTDPDFIGRAWSNWGFRHDGHFEYPADKHAVKCPKCNGAFTICSIGYKDTHYKVEGAKHTGAGGASVRVEDGWVKADDRGEIKAFGVHELGEVWEVLKIRVSKDDPSTLEVDTSRPRPGGPEQFFLLIGIDHYYLSEEGVKTSEKNKAVKYGPLTGCVRDIKAIHDYIRTQKHFTAKEENIYVLLAESPGGTYVKASNPKGDPKKWPTHQNIVDTIKLITKRAHPGDLVYIHYSGHGGSTKPTVYPELKGRGQLDESLVPCDIHMPGGGKYLLDLEFALYLDVMAKKQLVVSVVLDSCHSSGATRDAIDDALSTGVARCGSGIDTQPHTPAISQAEMLEYFGSSKKGSGGATRDAFQSDALIKDGLFLMNTEKYELLAACRLDQKAREDLLGSPSKMHGIFTYHYLQVLKEAGDNPVTHGQIFERVQSMIDAWRVQKQITAEVQAPGIQGRANRVLFSTEIVPENKKTSVRVSAHPDDEEFVTIHAGAAQTVCKDAEYYLFPWNDKLLRPTDKTPKVRVTKANELKSVAIFIDEELTLKPEELADGKYIAVPVEPPATPLKVYLQPSDGPAADKKLLEDLKNVKSTTTMRIPVDLDYQESKADYRVHVDNGRYKLDRLLHSQTPSLTTPSSPVFMFPPALTWEAKHFMDGLTHLARYDTVKNLTNKSTLDGKFEFKLIDTLFRSGTPCKGKISNNSHTIDVKSGHDIQLFFANHHPSTSLNVVIFSLNPTFAIRKLYPSTAEPYAIVTETSEMEQAPLQFKMTLPKDMSPQRMTTEHIMAIVFLDKEIGPNFDALTLEPMSQLTGNPSNRGSDALGELFDKLGMPGRDATAVTVDPLPWATKLITINVYPPGEPLP